MRRRLIEMERKWKEKEKAQLRRCAATKCNVINDNNDDNDEEGDKATRWGKDKVLLLLVLDKVEAGLW